VDADAIVARLLNDDASDDEDDDEEEDDEEKYRKHTELHALPSTWQVRSHPPHVPVVVKGLSTTGAAYSRSARTCGISGTAAGA
jgi:hypothetical protein